MIPAIFVLLYLCAVIYIGVFAFRKSRGGDKPEEFFLAGRTIGPVVFLLSLFGTNMTAFAILGSSGHSFHNGIVTFGMMASSSGLIIPLSFFFIGTRVWSLGKKHGFMTPVQMFRDRWECGHIGTVIFAVQAALLIPYIIIGVMGGGTTLEGISGGLVPFWAGGLVVAIVVMIYVVFGGMRGTAWVNAFQTSLFVLFGAVAVVVIGNGMGGFDQAIARMAASPGLAPLLSRERIPPLAFLSYTFIPLSTMVFPHICIFCLTAKKASQFKRTVIAYPVAMASVFLPCVFLGVVANTVTDSPAIVAKQEARRMLATQGAAMSPAERDVLRAKMASDDVLLILLEKYAPLWLAGLLGAGIMAAVMASDSQILALSTMFTEDVFAYYGGTTRYGEAAQVHMGRLFIVAITAVAYAIALKAPASIFDLAVQYAFTGYAAMFPLLVAAIYWRGSTKWGALASTLCAACGVVAVAAFQSSVPAPAPGPPMVMAKLGEWDLIARTASGTSVLGLMPVVPLTLLSAALMIVVSKMTAKPRQETLARYF